MLVKTKFTQKKMKFRQKMIFYMLVYCIIPFITISSIFIVFSYNTSRKDLLNHYESQLQKCSERINECVQLNTSKTEMLIRKNPDLIAFLIKDNSSGFSVDYFERYTMLSHSFDIILNATSQKTYSIYAFNDTIFEGAEYIKRIDSLDSAMKEMVMNSSYDTLLYFPFDSITDFSSKKLYLYTKIYYFNKLIAISELEIPAAEFFNPATFQIPEGSIFAYFTSYHSAVVFQNNGVKEDQADLLVDSAARGASLKSYYTIRKPLSIDQDALVLFLPQSHIWDSIQRSTYAFFIILVLSIGFIVYLGIFTSSYLTRNLNSLMKKLDDDTENLIQNNQFMSSSHDEFGKINEKFYELITRIKNYYEDLSRYKYEKRQLELLLLQERLNPHLLYNTLASITYLYHDEKLNKAVNALIKYYRIALNKCDEILKITEETDLVEQYVEIQRFSYAKEIELDIHIEEDAIECKVPKHLLQPLVENAILHGILSSEADGVIKINIYKESDNLIITLRDNGSGIEEDKLQAIRTAGPGSSFGLNNLRNRIRTYFGEEYGLTIESQVNAGTCITISLPCRF